MAGFLPFAEWDEEREEINDQLETMYTNDICAYQVINQCITFLFTIVFRSLFQVETNTRYCGDAPSGTPGINHSFLKLELMVEGCLTGDARVWTALTSAP